MSCNSLTTTLCSQDINDETANEGEKDPVSLRRSSLNSNRWHKAFNLLKAKRFVLDPWHDFDLETSQIVGATRFRYSAIKKKWIQDSVQVRVEAKSFDRGAMRECYRLKKLTSSGDWKAASNYVAKRYIEQIPRETYFDDVRLQVEAKLWGEAFNRCDPPKKIDIFQLSIIETEVNGEKQMYHIERFMEGEYRKYNSNSGFVDEQLRNTPQAFSHFTFERSGHRLMIVDIQGVGDLYTDPQIHTSDGAGYSDGNLGLRGMALFFHSHRCNPICEYLGLAPFDLSSTERPKEEPSVANPEEDISLNALLSFSSEFLNLHEEEEKPGRRRTVSCNTSRDSLISNSSRVFGPTVVRRSQESLSSPSSLSQSLSMELLASRERVCSADSGFHNFAGGALMTMDSCNELSPQLPARHESSIFNFASLDLPPPCSRRIRTSSESSDVDFEILHEAANSPGQPTHPHHYFHHLMHEARKPASADHPTNLDQEIGQSILGQIHHELARLHEAGRFVEGREEIAWSAGKKKNKSVSPAKSRAKLEMTDFDPENHGGALAESTAGQVDWISVLFHEKHAAQLGCLEAMIVMAHYYLGLPSTLLHNCPIESQLCDLSLGIDYLWRAAEGGDRRCMILLARYLDTYAEGHPEKAQKETAQWRRFITTPSHLLVLPKLAQAMLESESQGEAAKNEINLPAVTGKPWAEAQVWYRRAVDAALMRSNSRDSETCDRDGDAGLDAEGRYDAADDLLPVHRLLARLAELNIVGGHGIVPDPSKAGDLFNEAGESASLVREGQLAMKYFELAEEAWALAPQEDEQ